MAQSNAASSGLFLSGSRESGMDVRINNVTAVLAVANVVKSSLGPVGLDKMLVDDIGDVTITNDGATILQQLELEHPAARLLVDLATLQDHEVGDGTTSVVLLAAQLVRVGHDLIASQGLHPTNVLQGYRHALKAALAYLKDTKSPTKLVTPVSSVSQDHLLQAAKTSMSSKIIGKEADYFANLAVQAVQSVKTVRGAGGKPKYPLSAIHILKVHGKSSLESQVLPGGFALATSRAAQGMPTQLESDDSNGTLGIALLDMNLQRHRMGMGITLQVNDPQEVERIKQKELEITKNKIQLLLDAGAKIVITTKGIDDVCMKYFVQANVIAARRVPLDDVKRLARATGGTILATLADLEGNESVDPQSLGRCRAVHEVRVGDSELLQFLDCKPKPPAGDGDATTSTAASSSSTILLRGANEYMLDEMDRSLHDALAVVKRMLESNSLVPGGGAVETALSVYLQGYAHTSTDNREQLALLEFANALLVIPQQLAVNAAQDASQLTAELRAAHAQAQNSQVPCMMGLDLVQGRLRDMLAAGVVEPTVSKLKALRFATEAALTILRIDDRITVEEPGGGGR